MTFGKLSAGLAFLVGLMVAFTSPVFAHAELLRSDPAPNSTVSAPKTFKLTFSEKVVPAFSGFKLAMGDGMTVDVTTKLSGDGITMTGTPKGSFMPGTYKLSWHAAAVDDGHRTEGSFTFKVK